MYRSYWCMAGIAFHQIPRILWCSIFWLSIGKARKMKKTKQSKLSYKAKTRFKR